MSLTIAMTSTRVDDQVPPEHHEQMWLQDVLGAGSSRCHTELQTYKSFENQNFS
jgi:hypothetical protein